MAGFATWPHSATANNGLERMTYGNERCVRITHSVSLAASIQRGRWIMLIFCPDATSTGWI